MFGRWLWHAMTLFMVLDYTSAYGLPILCHFRCVLPDVHVYNRIPASERQFASSTRQFFSGLSNLFPRSCRRHCMNSKIYAGSGLRQGMPTRLCRSQHFGVAFWWKALVFRKEEKCSAAISRPFESGTDGLRLDKCKMMIRLKVSCHLQVEPQHADFAWDLSHYPESTRRDSHFLCRKMNEFKSLLEDAEKLISYDADDQEASWHSCKNCSHAVMESSSEFSVGESLHEATCMYLSYLSTRILSWEFIGITKLATQRICLFQGFGVEAPCHERTEHGNLEKETPTKPHLRHF